MKLKPDTYYTMANGGLARISGRTPPGFDEEYPMSGYIITFKGDMETGRHHSWNEDGESWLREFNIIEETAYDQHNPSVA